MKAALPRIDEHEQVVVEEENASGGANLEESASLTKISSRYGSIIKRQPVTPPKAPKK